MSYHGGALLLALLLPATARADDSYRLGAGDVVEVAVFQEETLTNRYPINDDGHIEMPLLGAVKASGLSVDELDTQITSALGERYLVNPQVTIQVKEFHSQVVQVLGDVNEPGVYPLTGSTTLEEILALAGGVRSDRATREAMIKNEREGGQRVVNLNTLRISGEDAVYLRGGDVVYILQGQIVSVNGLVKDPGDIPFRDGMTVLDAVSAAGGQLPSANLRRVTLKRGDEFIQINLKRVIKQRDPDVVMLSGDKLIIDESPF